MLNYSNIFAIGHKRIINFAYIPNQPELPIMYIMLTKVSRVYLAIE